jgi:hypothetical protein
MIANQEPARMRRQLAGTQRKDTDLVCISALRALYAGS